MKTRYQARYYKNAEDEDAADYSDQCDTLKACVDIAQEVCDASEWKHFVVEKIEDVATYSIASKWVKL